MSEARLQSEMVLEFSQNMPEERGLLWSTRNNTFSARDGMTQRGMGMIAGVSDLIYFKHGQLICIEVKHPDKSHNKDHIRQQLDWGLKIEEQGGLYYIVNSVDAFWAVINWDENEGIYTTLRIEMLLNKGKSKVKFV